MVAALEVVPDEFLGCAACHSAIDMMYAILDSAEHFEPEVVLEMFRAEGLIAQLTAMPVGEALSLVLHDGAFHQWGLVQQLLASSRSLWLQDCRASLERALLAVALVERLDPAFYQPLWLADLRAKAHAYLANAHRIRGDFAAAHEHFRFAEEAVHAGTRSGRAEATVLLLKASLLIDEYRLLEARAALDRVERYQALHGDGDEQGRTQLKKAKLAYMEGDHVAAYHAARCAAQLLYDPVLTLIAAQDAVMFLLEMGQVSEARRQLDNLPRPASLQLSTRRRWVEGLVASAEGNEADSRDALRSVREDYALAGLPYDVALVSLDLAMVELRAGETNRVLRLIEETVVLLTKSAAPFEVFAPLRVALAAAEQHRATTAVLLDAKRRIGAHRPH